MRTLKKLSGSSRGFTLIEMAIVILILGILIGAFSPLYALYIKNQKLQDTQNNISIISSSIGAFRSVNGRYPCPASLTAQRGDLNYGREDCTDLSNSPTGTNTAPGTCYSPNPQTQICVENSQRGLMTYTYPAGNNRVNQALRVLVGAVPFRHLNIYEDNAYDGNDNRILYVVTESLTCSSCFQPNQGGIQILNQNGATVLTPSSSAHFLIISPGENGNGAITANGVQAPCNGASIEAENCDFATVADGTYQFSDTRDTGVPGTSYDDVISYFTQDEIPLWQTSALDAANIHQKATGNIGFASTAASAIAQRGSVSGTARVQDDPDLAGDQGKVLSTQLCNSTTTGYCISTEIIAGDNANMQCPNPLSAGQFMRGITYTAADGTYALCSDEVIARCPNGRTVSGINADGTLRCGTPPGCPDGTGSICGSNQPLLAGPNGTTRTITGGASGSITYTCTNGSWQPGPQSGICNCTPTPVGGDVYGPYICGSGFDGQYNWTLVRTCPAGTETWTNNADTACRCLTLTETEPQTCPPGFTNNGYQRTHDHVCTGPNTGYWTPWVYTGSCDCVPATRTIHEVCPTGLTGTGRDYREDFTCPDGQWHRNPTPIVDDCTCTVDTIPGTRLCEDENPSTIGTIYGTYTKQCPSGVYGAFVETSRDCQPKPPVVCGWNNQDAGIVQTAPIGPAKSSFCTPCGKISATGCNLSLGGGNFRNYSACVCE